MVDYSNSQSHFLEHGFCILQGVLSAEDVRFMCEAADELNHGAKSMSNQVLFTHTSSPDNTPPLSDLMNQWLNPHRLLGRGSTSDVAKKLNRIASKLFDEPMQIYQDLILCKNGGHKEFPWHQDAPFWPLQFEKAATFWAPTCAVDESNGGLRLAPDAGESVFAAVNLHTGLRQDGTGEFQPSTVFTPSLEPGDVLVFSPTMLHASGVRHEQSDRIAYASVFVDMGAKWDHDRAPNHPMCEETVHGQLVCG